VTWTVVVMGVSGSGKSTVGGALAARLGVAFLEGDDLHPAANIAKMRAGIPLDDADRLPWLHAVAAWIGERERAGEDAVVSCSALHRSYRDLLREGHPSVRFLQLTLDPARLADRVAERTGHFMPPSLLGSQLATMEPLAADEPGLTLANEGPLDDVVTAAARVV
jgi:gluconokinase